MEFIEAKLMSNERAALETKPPPQIQLPPSLPGNQQHLHIMRDISICYPPLSVLGGSSSSLLPHQRPAPSHTLMHTTSLLMIPETSLNKRLRFEARVLTQ